MVEEFELIKPNKGVGASAFLPVTMNEILRQTKKYNEYEKATNKTMDNAEQLKGPLGRISDDEVRLTKFLTAGRKFWQRFLGDLAPAYHMFQLKESAVGEIVHNM